MDNNRIRWFSIVRVLGLSLVFVYHFFKDLLPAGFIGVDVFFTFSGYLITALAVEEFRKKNSFNLFAFLKRRFLRIFPPLFFAVAFSLPFTLLVSPDFTTKIVKQAAAALGFVTNYFEVLSGGSYEARMLPNLFVHTWSLAVEMHFYITWGLFFAIATLFVRKVVTLKIVLCGISMLLAVLSFIQMQLLYNVNFVDPSVAYFDTTAHAFPFFWGAALGAVFGIHIGDKTKLLISGWFARLAAICALIVSLSWMIAIARTLSFSDEITYRFGFLLASLFATVIIASARVLHESTKTSEPWPLYVLANISYAMYLFHWPLYIIFSNVFLNSNLIASLVTIAVSLALSVFVYYGIEPVLHGKKHPKYIYALLITIIMSGTAFSAYVCHNASDISVLEQELLTGYIQQDSDAIYSLKDMAEAINPTPVVPPNPVIFSKSVIAKGDRLVAPIIREVQAMDAPSREGIVPGVTIIGDSMCMGARKALLASIPNSRVDAQGSRPIADGYSIMMNLQKSGALREYVVIALGTNANAKAFDKIEQIISEINPGHRLIFVTPFNGAMTETWLTYKTGVYMRTLPAKYPFVTVADWVAVIEPHKHLLGADKVHLGGNEISTNMYTNNIIDALNEAARKPAKE